MRSLKFPNLRVLQYFDGFIDLLFVLLQINLARPLAVLGYLINVIILNFEAFTFWTHPIFLVQERGESHDLFLIAQFKPPFNQCFHRCKTDNQILLISNNQSFLQRSNSLNKSAFPGPVNCGSSRLWSPIIFFLVLPSTLSSVFPSKQVLLCTSTAWICQCWHLLALYPWFEKSWESYRSACQWSCLAGFPPYPSPSIKSQI